MFGQKIENLIQNSDIIILVVLPIGSIFFKKHLKYKCLQNSSKSKKFANNFVFKKL